MRKKFFEIPADLDTRFKKWCQDHEMTQREVFMLALEKLMTQEKQPEKED